MAVEPKRLLTYEDFLAFPDDGVRREIVDGEALVTPAPNIRDQDLVGFVFDALYDHLKEHPGRVFVAPVDVRLSEHDVVEPDVVFVAEERTDIIQEKFLLGSPSLLIEVLSDPRTDRVRKRALYARADVAEYWIVDPDADRVEVYRLGRGRYGKPDLFDPGDTLMTELLPGFSLDIATLFDR
jgi:Uma2 family endonuclease